MEKAQALVDGIEEKQLEMREGNLQRQSGKSGPGADICQPARAGQIDRRRAGERIEEMLIDDRVGLLDRGEIEPLIPIKQESKILTVAVELLRIEFDPEAPRAPGKTC